MEVVQPVGVHRVSARLITGPSHCAASTCLALSLAPSHTSAHDRGILTQRPPIIPTHLCLHTALGCRGAWDLFGLSKWSCENSCGQCFWAVWWKGLGNMGAGAQHMHLNTLGDEEAFETKGFSGVFMTPCPRCPENLVISRAASGLKLRAGSESGQ